MPDQKEVNLLLVGRTGNGKSATGNSILGRKAFNASMNSEPLAEADIRLETREEDHRHISVVDGPGIGDASLNDADGVKRTISQTVKALNECPDGFNAVLLVLKYGDRFTTQEKDAVRMLKGILGSRVLESHGVVVMTRGDSFEVNQEEDGVCFEDWCGRQTGDVAEIFQECQGRFVLFDNRTKTEDKLKQQREELLKQVDKLSRYTMQDYDSAKQDRRRLEMSSQLGIMEGTNRKFVDKTTAVINELDISRNPNEAKDKITVLQSKLDKYRQQLQKNTEGTDVATSMLLELDILAFSLGNKLELAARTLELQEKTSQARRQHGNGTSKKSGNKKEKRKQSDSKESYPPNGGARASSSRDHRYAGNSQKRAIRDPSQGNPDETQASHATSHLQRNTATTSSSQPAYARAQSDHRLNASDRKQRKQTSNCRCM